MRKVHGYINSHIYELHSLIAATLATILLYLIKDKIKQGLDNFVENRAFFDEKWRDNKALYKRRCHMVLIVLDLLIAFFLFGGIAWLSPYIRFSVYNAVMSGVFSLTEYAVLDQLCIDGREDI